MPLQSQGSILAPPAATASLARLHNFTRHRVYVLDAGNAVTGVYSRCYKQGFIVALVT